MTLRIQHPSGATRSSLFPTLPRPETTHVCIRFLHCPADDRIDIRASDNHDAIKGFFGASHHYLIKTDGTVQIGRGPKTVSTVISPQYRECTLVIGVVGGVDGKDGKPAYTLSEVQNEAINELLQDLADALGTELEVVDKTESTRRWVEKHGSKEQLEPTPEEQLEDKLNADQT